jgi:hypothetical protein
MGATIQRAFVPRASPLSEVLRAWQLVLPDSAAFTSLTAAEIRGWWLPQAIPHPVFAAVPIGGPYPKRKGLLSRGIRQRFRP